MADDDATKIDVPVLLVSFLRPQQPALLRLVQVMKPLRVQRRSVPVVRAAAAVVVVVVVTPVVITVSKTFCYRVAVNDLQGSSPVIPSMHFHKCDPEDSLLINLFVGSCICSSRGWEDEGLTRLNMEQTFDYLFIYLSIFVYSFCFHGIDKASFVGFVNGGFDGLIGKTESYNWRWRLLNEYVGSFGISSQSLVKTHYFCCGMHMPTRSSLSIFQHFPVSTL